MDWKPGFGFGFGQGSRDTSPRHTKQPALLDTISHLISRLPFLVYTFTLPPFSCCSRPDYDSHFYFSSLSLCLTTLTTCARTLPHRSHALLRTPLFFSHYHIFLTAHPKSFWLCIDIQRTLSHIHLFTHASHGHCMDSFFVTPLLSAAHSQRRFPHICSAITRRFVFSHPSMRTSPIFY